jgi:hypothetical protein
VIKKPHGRDDHCPRWAAVPEKKKKKKKIIIIIIP